MAGRELAVRKVSAFNLREESAKAVLRSVWSKGHVYVELREVGKRFIFFCTLCLTRCFSDSALSDHLRGNLHSKRCAFAKSTLFGDVPWPFNDGVLFFFNSPEKEKQLSHPKIAYLQGSGMEHDAVSDPSSTNGYSGLLTNGNCRSSNSVDMDADSGNLKIVECGNGNGLGKGYECGNTVVVNGHCKSLACRTSENYQLIHDVLVREKISALPIWPMGFGHINSRICENNETGSKVCKLWCAWLGEGESDDKDVLSTIAECDFAIVNFPYTSDLGRRGTTDEQDHLLSSGSLLENEDAGGPRKRIKQSFSDPETNSGGFSEQGDSSCEDSSSSNDFASKALVSTDDQIQSPRLTSSKAIRRDLRRQKCLAAERICDICQQPMLADKDVAALLNVVTGNLACSSRNTNGAFHVYHISCLIHWILVCEFEIRNDKPLKTKIGRGRKGRMTSKRNFTSILCPECQGTGTDIVEDQLEKPTVHLSEMFRYKLKAIQAHRSWMEDPEILRNCSTGLRFSSEELKGKALPMKLLRFYRADI